MKLKNPKIWVTKLPDKKDVANLTSYGCGLFCYFKERHNGPPYPTNYHPWLYNDRQRSSNYRRCCSGCETKCHVCSSRAYTRLACAKILSRCLISASLISSCVLRLRVTYKSCGRCCTKCRLFRSGRRCSCKSFLSSSLW